MDKKKFVTANGQNFACKEIRTSIGAIYITLENQELGYLEEFFRSVTGITWGFEDEEKPRGVYTEPEYSLAYESIEKHADGTITIKMHIKTAQEMRMDNLEERLAALEAGEEIQNVAIQELGSITGGGVR